MYKLWIATYKEILLLKRDIGGLIILFVMPLVLVITVTLIQNSSFVKDDNVKVPIILIDNDGDTLSESIISTLKEANTFEIFSDINGEKIDETKANELVLKGKYKMAIIIPKGLTSNLNSKVSQNVNSILSELGMEDDIEHENKDVATQEIRLYFDPAAHLSFKNEVKNAIDKMVTKIESDAIYRSFQSELEIEGELFDNKELFTFVEVNPRQDDLEIRPNSVQHNVPAWTLFALFLIVIPLSINIVKEKNQGTYVRLRTNPVSYATILSSKVLVYLLICLLQFLMILMIGLYLFPYLELPKFVINGSYFLLFFVTIFSSLAAIGLGVLLGTLSTTQEQSAPMGAMLVVLLAAMGGIWIPVFMMPKVMQFFAMISPMNWGLNSFYDVIIRSGNIVDVLPEISLLGLFFIVMLVISIYYDKAQNSV
jgi:ABC-2 type transport system permease protein